MSCTLHVPKASRPGPGLGEAQEAGEGGSIVAIIDVKPVLAGLCNCLDLAAASTTLNGELSNLSSIEFPLVERGVVVVEGLRGSSPPFRAVATACIRSCIRNFDHVSWSLLHQPNKAVRATS